MKKYLNFINEDYKPVMKYYAYDWDNNILNMPTVIHMQHLVDGKWIDEDVSTAKFAEVRSLDDWRDYEKSYVEFRDFGPRGNMSFLEDCKVAIQNNQFGPVWDKFIETLINGSIFAIITARGHEPDTLRKGIQYIIDTLLTQEQKNEMVSNLIGFQDMFVQNFDVMRDISSETLISAYLDKCDFVGVSSPSFESKYKNSQGGASNPEKMKILALQEFVDRINTYGEQIGGIVSLGFSDDDVKNVDKVYKYFGEI